MQNEFRMVRFAAPWVDGSDAPDVAMINGVLCYRVWNDELCDFEGWSPVFTL